MSNLMMKAIFVAVFMATTCVPGCIFSNPVVFDKCDDPDNCLTIAFEAKEEYKTNGVEKMYFNPYGPLIAQRPEFFIALTTMIIGTQFFVAGFLGEIILQSRSHKERYQISEETCGK